MVNKLIDSQVKEVIKVLDITYFKDMEIIRLAIEQAYWTGKVEQMKEMEKQKEVSFI